MLTSRVSIGSEDISWGSRKNPFIEIPFPDDWHWMFLPSCSVSVKAVYSSFAIWNRAHGHLLISLHPTCFCLGWKLKEVNINGDFNQYIWAFSLGWTQKTDVRVTSSSLSISSGKPEEVFPTNIFSVLNECPTIIYWAKLSGEKVIEALIGQTSIFPESSQLHCVAPDESTQTGRQQRENFPKPK